jgi:homoserine kinase type II
LTLGAGSPITRRVAVYTDITDEALEAFLARYALGRPRAFKGIAEGVENSNFLLETDTGRYILTVYERRVRQEELPFFLDLMQWLAARGFPGATPIADREGRLLNSLEAKPAAIVAFLPGLSVRRPKVTHCGEAGEGLAWLHRAAEGFAGRRTNDLGQGAWAGLFAPHAAAAEALEPGLASLIARDLADLARLWPAGLPEGIVHADFFPDNVFFIDDRFAGAIDFYFAAWDALAYDLAVALNAWCFTRGGVFEAAKARAMIAGYERRRALSSAERAALPTLARGAAMRFFITRLADWGATPPGSLVQPKDPLEYARKLDAHRRGLSLSMASA